MVQLLFMLPGLHVGKVDTVEATELCSGSIVPYQSTKDSKCDLVVSSSHISNT